MKEQPEATAALHQRASGWYEGHGLTAAAVYHAFAADDMARAARIIELAWGEMDRNRQAVEWLGWAKKLPDALVLARPVLSVGYAWAFLDTGQMETAEIWLRQAEHCLAATTDFVVADEAEFQYLPGSIASARTYHALALGDMAGTIKYAHQASTSFPQKHISGAAPRRRSWAGRLGQRRFDRSHTRLYRGHDQLSKGRQHPVCHYRRLCSG
ncbi:MAG: hypothetical protein IPF56_10905 [Chloroflexi bacterium]|nr:hypothetical protein [Chloroflexota bacterium]